MATIPSLQAQPDRDAPSALKPQTIKKTALPTIAGESNLGTLAKLPSIQPTVPTTSATPTTTQPETSITIKGPSSDVLQTISTLSVPAETEAVPTATTPAATTQSGVLAGGGGTWTVDPTTGQYLVNGWPLQAGYTIDAATGQVVGSGVPTEAATPSAAATLAPTAPTSPVPAIANAQVPNINDLLNYVSDPANLNLIDETQYTLPTDLVFQNPVNYAAYTQLQNEFVTALTQQGAAEEEAKAAAQVALQRLSEDAATDKQGVIDQSLERGIFNSGITTANLNQSADTFSEYGEDEITNLLALLTGNQASLQNAYNNFYSGLYGAEGLLPADAAWAFENGLGGSGIPQPEPEVTTNPIPTISGGEISATANGQATTPSLIGGGISGTLDPFDPLNVLLRGY